MNLRTILKAVLLAIILLLSQLGNNRESAVEAGDWSREATYLDYQTPEIRRMEIVSPDGKKAAVVDGVKLDLMMNGKRLRGMEHVGVPTLAELAWSPDSNAFFVTKSLGGEVGDWHVVVYQVEGENVRPIYPTDRVIESFKKHYKCYEQEEPNVGALTWLQGSKQLLLAAQVPPHSSCPELGKVRGYIVEVPSGKILREFDQSELKAIYVRYLGFRFAYKFQ